MAIILVFASIAVFYSLRFAPGDPSGVQLNPATLEAVRAAYRERLGLNQPVYVQYFVYVGNLAVGDFGRSLVNGTTMPSLLTSYGKNSLILGGTAFLLTNLIG